MPSRISRRKTAPRDQLWKMEGTALRFGQKLQKLRDNGDTRLVDATTAAFQVFHEINKVRIEVDHQENRWGQEPDSQNASTTKKEDKIMPRQYFNTTLPGEKPKIFMDPEKTALYLDEIMQGQFLDRKLDKWHSLCNPVDDSGIAQSIQHLIHLITTAEEMMGTGIKDLEEIQSKVEAAAEDLVYGLCRVAWDRKILKEDPFDYVEPVEPEEEPVEPEPVPAPVRNTDEYRTSLAVSRLASKILGISVNAAMCLEWLGERDTRTIQALAGKMKTQEYHIRDGLKELWHKAIIDFPPAKNETLVIIEIGDMRVWNCVFGGSTLKQETSEG